MELSIAQQVSGLIEKNNSFLVALPAQPSLDSAASGLALRAYLAKLGKTVHVVTSGSVPRQLGFLEGTSEVTARIETSGSLTLVLDTSRTKLSELSYETKEDSVSIFLKAKEGSFNPSDVVIQNSLTQIGAIFILGSESFEALGGVFTENAELFYNLPKINVDIHPTNEYFGTVNIVDVTAGAVSEVLFSLFARLEMLEISEDIATALLAGVIANTNSFQGLNTTPSSLTVASELINLGAQQQDIIRHLYKTKELPLLKLWGRALARLKTQEPGFAYTAINASDFEKTETSTAYMPLLLQEFIDNVSGFKVFGVLAESNGAVEVAVTTHPQLQISRLLELLGFGATTPARLPNGGEYVHVRMPGNILDIENKVAEALNQSLPAKIA